MTNDRDTIYFPGLNGLRAIAALGVLISHLSTKLSSFNLHKHIFGTNANGTAKGYLLATHGVTIFFVLSGFLITYLLLSEKQKQKINIKNFYLRRILRIWPLYYFYFFICLIFIAIYSLFFEWDSFFLYIFMLANVAGLLTMQLPFLYHYWTIAVEEQFYLFWPFLIKNVGKRLVLLLFALITFQLILRVSLWYFYPYSLAANLSILMRFDCMMIGGLGAILFKQNHRLFLSFIDNRITQFICLSVIFLLIINQFHINAIVDTFIISIVALCLIIGQINVKNRLISFDNKIFDFLGKISYGIYVYHLIVIFFLHKFIFNFRTQSFINYLLVYTLVIGTTIVVAYISYEIFEKKFIKMKGKFSAVKSSNFRTQETTTY